MDDTAQPPQVGLSPPQNTLWSKVNSAIGVDPSFKVQPLAQQGDGSYQITVMFTGGGSSDPAGLAAILERTHILGNITVHVSVQYPQQVVINVDSPDSLAGAVRLGLRGNPYFVEAIKTTPNPWFPVPSVVAVITQTVIQFFNDDLSDYYRNFNGVAADVFGDILRLDYGNKVTLGTTTEPSNKEAGGAQDGGTGDTQDGGTGGDTGGQA